MDKKNYCCLPWGQKILYGQKTRFDSVEFSTQNSLKLTCDHVCQTFSGSKPQDPIPRDGEEEGNVKVKRGKGKGDGMGG
jgi:hypothetical protein